MGSNLYTYEVDRDGNVKRDSNSIPFLFYSRGTNQMESIHRQYYTILRHFYGIEMGDALFGDEVIITTYILFVI
jgi:hypothetical protein